MFLLSTSKAVIWFALVLFVISLCNGISFHPVNFLYISCLDFANNNCIWSLKFQTEFLALASKEAALHNGDAVAAVYPLLDNGTVVIYTAQAGRL